MVGGGMGSVGSALRDRLAGMVMVFWWVAVRERRSSAAAWMNL
jgi:hypothetical protein